MLHFKYTYWKNATLSLHELILSYKPIQKPVYMDPRREYNSDDTNTQIPEELKVSGENGVNQDLVFELGLVMAGAVSAGAYTAGVVDYLIEALEAWEKVKNSEWDLPFDQRIVPFHKVKIKVIAGASAGGITGALLATQIRNKAVGVQSPDHSSVLKEVWVDGIHIDALLEGSDLKNDEDEIRSLLDSTRISKIAEQKFNFEKAKTLWNMPPFIHENMKLLLTLSNLRGIPYEFSIEGETGFKYGMFDFTDYEKVTINKDTTANDWQRIKNAALATGAFPVGLSARLIHRDPKEYLMRSKEEKKDFISRRFDDQQTYSFTCVDGGVFNNEPLELARKELLRCSKFDRDLDKKMRDKMESGQIETIKENKIYRETLKHALILIDPFPNIIKVENENDCENSLNLFKVVPRLIAALRRQAIFKPQELLYAAHKHIYSSFLIAPVRYENGLKARYPLASGFLEGFGGFLFKGFRKHDYELGRRNCQRFLQCYFVVPEAEFKENKIFNGANGILLKKFEALGEVNECTGNRPAYLPIIPLIGAANHTERVYEHPNGKGELVSISNMLLEEGLGTQSKWPGYNKKEYARLLKDMRKRLRLLTDKLLPKSLLGKLVKYIPYVVSVFMIIAISLLFLEKSNKVPENYKALVSIGQSFIMLLVGMAFSVHLVFYAIRDEMIKKIERVLRKQLDAYTLIAKE